MQTQKFESYVSKTETQVLEFRTNKTEAWMDFAKYEPKNIKLFLIFLAKTIQTLKDKGCTTFVQSVSYDDWNKLLSKDKRWVVKNEYKSMGYLVIQCSMDNATKCIGRGLGVKE